MDEDQQVDPSVEVSQWLREVGRRRWSPPAAQSIGATLEPEVAESKPHSPAFRRTSLLALLLAVSLLYVYTDTQVEILSIRSLLIFVFPD